MHVFSNEAKLFYDSFTNYSRGLFEGEGEGVGSIHNGEFGRYRERAVERFLRLLTPQNLKFADGFILTPRNQVSTQCDIIIYSQEDTPLISDNNASFFPVESVTGVVEVKSTLSKSELTKALNKLAKIKRLREDIYNDHHNNLEISRKNNLLFPPKDHLWNQHDSLFTVLVCEKFKFDLKKVRPAECYDDDVPYRYRHNLILSLEDGVFFYNHERDHCWPVILKGNGMYISNNIFNPKDDGELPYLEVFGHQYNLGISMNSLFIPELRNYFDDRFDVGSIDSLKVPGWTP